MSNLYIDTADTRKVSKVEGKALIASGIGTMMEWYDFVVFAYLAKYISYNFFPSDNEGLSLLSTFATFGVGFLARPLGGYIFGAGGDKHGRRGVMMITMSIMAVSTAAIGLLPATKTVGLISPIILVIARLFQGLSAGGERSTAMVYAVEWAPANKRGLYGALNSAGSGLGLILGSATVSALLALLTTEQVSDWGWRIPFLLGALIGPIGLWIRKSIAETPVYENSMQEQKTPQATTADGIRLCLRIFLLDSFWSVAYYIFLAYMPTFAQKYVVGITGERAFLVNTTSLILYMAFTPVFGWLSDRIGRKILMIGSCLCFAVFTYPLFSLLLNGVSFYVYVCVICSFSIMLAVFSGAAVAMFVEQFPTNQRNLWFGVGYSLSTAVFGGFTPYIATWSISYFHSPISPAIYVIATAVLTIFLVARVKETAFAQLA